MSIKHLIIILLAGLLLPVSGFAQEKKKLEAFRLDQQIAIDGTLDEAIWQQAETAGNFVQVRPYNGKPGSASTIVKVLYDNKGLYIGAIMTENKPDSLGLELTRRDDTGMADHFGLKIDPYNDGLNSFGFFVTTRGVQLDFKTNKDGEEDETWDAVWRSSVQVNDSGWAVEFMIPYSAIRFSKQQNPVWGVNFYRSIQRLRELDSWNYIDLKVKSELSQAGELTGLINVKPPLRLSATPYLSGNAENHGNESWNTFANYGLDLKCGLSESFTLDMTLIPDFGQVESDNRIFSLSPFETFYEEKRPFFTEGTELFSKGNVFYSRRIGAQPSGYSSKYSDQGAAEVISNPESTQLINAAKLSGKTSGGLGVGVFNAMTANTYATIKDSTGQKRDILTEPFTNFNMFIVDQSLKNNSYISVYNTSVYQPEKGTNANVSGTDFRLRNGTNRYELGGIVNVSQHYGPKSSPAIGHKIFLQTGQVAGSWKYNGWLNIESDTYDPNDMGFLMNNNEFSTGINVRYNIYEPTGTILKMYNSAYASLSYLYNPRKFSLFEIGGNNVTTFTNNLTIGGNFEVKPFKTNDYFEARVPGRVFSEPANFHVNAWSSPDYRKKFLVDLTLGVWTMFGDNRTSWWTEIYPRIRLNNHLLIRPRLEMDFNSNNRGYVTDSLNADLEHVIIFGRRDVKNITTSISADYVFSRSTSLSFRLRHYWLRVNYFEFYDLQVDGSLIPSSYNENHNFSINAFNIDMVFKWDFAPGSELLLVWKNAVYENTQSPELKDKYFDNLHNLFLSPAHNSFVIKLLYYIDWQYFKKNKPLPHQDSRQRID